VVPVISSYSEVFENVAFQTGIEVAGALPIHEASLGVSILVEERTRRDRALIPQ
jgi:hypothetical protein